MSSRQPSPGPSQHIHASQSQMFHQIPLNSSAAGPSAKLRTRPFVPGITAGAEDVKYHAKYKELKKKVKEIESVRCGFCSVAPPDVLCAGVRLLLAALLTPLIEHDCLCDLSCLQDNDRLYLKLLLAKKNIRRMNLERA